MFIALVFLAHIYVDLIVTATNVLVVFLSTINKHFLLLLFKILAINHLKNIHSLTRWGTEIHVWFPSILTCKFAK